jgi:hypothetical protein
MINNIVNGFNFYLFQYSISKQFPAMMNNLSKLLEHSRLSIPSEVRI